ncbi:hypothetical protein RI367_001470 [Sorochytrium milnesiophthora]
MTGQPTSSSEQRPLFGGAISALVPANFADTSQFREVPDNQEVFVDMQSDVSLIFELLELAEGAGADKVADYHYHRLLEDSDATSEAIHDIRTLQPGTMQLSASGRAFTAQRLVATMRAAKFNQRAQDTVAVVLWAIRLPDVATDVLITFNVPLQVTTSNATPAPRLSDAHVAEMQRVASSFAIHDWSLFA